MRRYIRSHTDLSSKESLIQILKDIKDLDRSGKVIKGEL